MARIRSIKPDAFRSDTLSRCSVLARWTFAGLWTYCDDYGKGRYNAKLILSDLFPLDDSTDLASLSGALDELREQGCICVYMVGGTEYFHCPKWGDHQKVSHPTKSKLPDHEGCPLTCTLENSGENLEPLAKPPDTLRPEGKGTGKGTGNREGKGKGEGPRKRGSRIPDGFAVTEAMVEWAREKCPGVDGRRETEKFITYWQAASGRTATKVSWRAAWQHWMLKAIDDYAPRNSQSRNGVESKPKPWTPPPPSREIANDPAKFHAYMQEQRAEHAREVGTG